MTRPRKSRADFIALFVKDCRRFLDGASKERDAVRGGTETKVTALFAFAHTMKGSAAILSLSRAEALASAICELLRPVHDGRASLDDEARAALLDGMDAVTGLLDQLDQDGEPAEVGFEPAPYVDALTRARPVAAPPAAVSA